MRSGIDLIEVTRALNAIAPLHLAAAWDNVGLLIEPSTPKNIRTIFMTIDLTTNVLQEAQRANADLVVAYHPPLFKPVKRIGKAEAVIRQAIENSIALYSPHTALDAVEDGINDWLLGAFGPLTKKTPLIGTQSAAHNNFKLVVFVPNSHLLPLRTAMSKAGAGHIGDYEQCSFASSGEGSFWGTASTQPTLGKKNQLELVEEVRLEMVCDKGALPIVAQAIMATHPYEEPAWDVYPLHKKPLLGQGQGRSARLGQVTSSIDLIARIKSYLGLEHVRVALPEGNSDPKIKTVAVCPGAGGSLFAAAAPHDFFLTGEMRHHDVLEKISAGAVVVLTEHTNTERGYLPVYAQRLRTELGENAEDLNIVISTLDTDPLKMI